MNRKISLSDLSSIDISNYKGLLIDIDDTLYSYESAHNIAIDKCAIKFKEELPSQEDLDEESFKIIYRDCRNKVTKRLDSNGSCRSRLLAFQLLFESLRAFNPLDSYKYSLDFEEYYWSILIENIERNEQMYIFVHRCLAQGHKVCAISDMQTSFQIRKMIKMDYKDILLVTSEEVGVEKPDKLIFQYALKKIGLTSDEVIMIGDSYSKDIVGAENIGIKSYQISLND